MASRSPPSGAGRPGPRPAACGPRGRPAATPCAAGQQQVEGRHVRHQASRRGDDGVAWTASLPPARGARSGGRRLAVQACISEVEQPANFSISRQSSTKGTPRSSASMRPSVDLPAPRRPTSAMRRASRRAASSPRPCPAVRRWRRAPGATSPRCSPPASRGAQPLGRSRRGSPINSANGHCNARATWSSTRIEALPEPYSRLARWRSDTRQPRDRPFRVMPRRSAWSRTRSPRPARKGFFSAPWPRRAPCSTWCQPARGPWKSPRRC